MSIFLRLKATAFLAVMVVISLLMLSCSEHSDSRVDGLNEMSYAYHYRNLDSTRHYAMLAYSLSGNYGSGKAEAMNNLAFVDIVKMRYADAARRLDSIPAITDNEIELLIADIQMMRLCQRQSHNKSFYEYMERANSRLKRIGTEDFTLNEHEKRRFAYAESEFRLVASAYYYYLGLTKQSVDMVKGIDPYGPIQRDTAQLLNYWYNIGSGGVITGKTSKETAQEEFTYLIWCYSLATEKGYPFWKAQAMQALSEHLQDKKQCRWLVRDNYPSILYINTDNMPDTLLAGNLAQRSHDIFVEYGDVYQTAGALRTLAECYWHIGDYRSALICLNKALSDKRFVNQAPDLVASIREQLCLSYSAINDKLNSDRNRNIYLDLQENTRQDKQLEARASQLDRSSMLLNFMIATVVLMIVIVAVLLLVFARMRKRSDDRFSMNALLEPLRQWQQRGEEENTAREEQMEDISEETGVARLHLQQNRRRNLEQRAKVQLVNSVLPLIDRMVNEVRRLENGNGSLDYISALTDNINQCNSVLTQWIQMRQGEISLHIESFPLQKLFDILAHGSMRFKLKGINLVVKDTDSVVKADRVLTLFMLNTIAGNAIKFTPKGGTVAVSAEQGDGYVEISVSDNGKGMDAETQEHIFDRTYTGGHGFGLKNCNGIIEKYKKLSRLFSVCLIGAKSKVGEGTRIFFRLPLGRVRAVVVGLLLALVTLPQIASDSITSLKVSHESREIAQKKAMNYADSAYLANVQGSYSEALRYADSCRHYVSANDTTILLDVSNETAVAALALHDWQLYHESNSFYTHLFREASADSSLPQYVRAMQRNNTNKTVAVVLLVMLLMIIFPAYYFLYYRHKLNYKLCVDRIDKMNELLLSGLNEKEKLDGIEKLDDFDRFNLSTEQRRSLKTVVSKIEEALSASIANKSEQETKVELATDELNRLRLDSDKLYISNSVLDNCLSTLKHETMYYPSRIRQLIDTDSGNIQAIKEVVDYYHDLYAILAEQATRQVVPQRIDKETVDYLLEILKNRNGDKPIQIIVDKNGQSQGNYDKRYTLLRVRMDHLQLSSEQLSALFTPSTMDVNFLLCRQLVREMGEATNLRACGISATCDEKGCTVIEILLPKRYAMMISIKHNIFDNR